MSTLPKIPCRNKFYRVDVQRKQIISYHELSFSNMMAENLTPRSHYLCDDSGKAVIPVLPDQLCNRNAD